MIVLLFLGKYAFDRLSLSRKIAVRLGLLRNAGYPVTLAELNKWYSEVPSEENAAHVYSRAFSNLSLRNTNSSELPIIGRGKLPPRTVPLSDESKKTIDDLLANNRAALGLLHEGSSRRKCRYPIDMTPGLHALLPHLPKLKMSAQLLELDALIKAEAGDIPGATRTIADMWALSESLAKEPITVSQLVRIAGKEIALSTLERILNRQSLGPDELAALSQMLDAERDDAALRCGWIGERCFGLDIFHMPNGKLTSFMKDPNGSSETGRDWSVLLGLWVMRLSGHLDRDELFFLESTHSYIRAIDVPYPKRLEISGDFSRKVAQARVYREGETRPFIISGLLLPSLGKVFEKHATHAARCRAAKVSLALEQHRLRHNGLLPDSLQELVPTWLGQLPTDPFDGRPLRYRRSSPGYVLYSVGPDTEDNGGQEKRDDRRIQSEEKQPYDITFTVER